MLKTPGHIRCFEEEVTSTDALLRMPFDDFVRGMHMCYNDAVFTADWLSLMYSKKFAAEMEGLRPTSAWPGSAGSISAPAVP